MNTKRTLDLLMARLGNKTEPEFRELCLAEMQLAQETQLEGMPQLPWFLEMEDTLVTVVGERTIDLPDDFIREVDEGRPLVYLPTDGGFIHLSKKGYDEALNYYEAEEGAPEAYALIGNKVAIFPLANEVFSILLPGYYARQPAPADTEGNENQWFKWAADLVIATTGEVMAIQHLQSDNPALLDSFVQMRVRAQQRLNIMTTAREEANRDRSMG